MNWVKALLLGLLTLTLVIVGSRLPLLAEMTPLSPGSMLEVGDKVERPLETLPEGHQDANRSLVSYGAIAPAPTAISSMPSPEIKASNNAALKSKSASDNQSQPPPANADAVSSATTIPKPPSLKAPKPRLKAPAFLQARKNKFRPQPFDEVTADTEKLKGVFNLYRDRESGKTYLEVQPDQLDKNFLASITLESGIGDLGIYSGWPLRSFLFQFRRVQNRLQFVVPNTYFRTSAGDPQQRAINRSFSDSVLYSLTIQSIHPDRKSLLIDLSELLIDNGDLAGLADEFPWLLGENYAFSEDKSYLSEAKNFPFNAEIEAVYGFSGGGNDWIYLDSVPDSRAFSLRVRYSFSALPEDNGYQPRIADDRVGYFIAAHQDFSNLNRRDPFKRYIRRWHLEKQDPSLPLSPPKEPIVFWIENTVPKPYREAIREGALMWNDAFEQIGFENAIEVRQMPDDAEWDPADIRYNTIRWSASFGSGVLGLGPSRVNPINGQILDADIVLDASALARYFHRTYGVLTQENANPIRSRSAAFSLCNYGEKLPYLYWRAERNPALKEVLNQRWPLMQSFNASAPVRKGKVCFGLEAAEQGSLGLLSLSLLPNPAPSPANEARRVYANQFLRYLTAHEVGHTLGLRHNFRGSTLLKPEELHNPDLTQRWGLVSSVMDYVPVNLAPEGQPQGEYYSTVLGPYDLWAIEYGYKPISAFNPREERRQLKRIAQRASEPGLSYSPDEDSFNLLDPTSNRWDLSNDMLTYSQWQMGNARRMWQALDRRYPSPGDDHSELRDRFHIIFSHYARHAMKATRYIGGQTFKRENRNAFTGRRPFEPIPVDQQRQALALLQRHVFAADAFNDISPDLL